MEWPAPHRGEGIASAAIVGMLDELTDGFFVFDQDWRFRYINEPGARMLGRPREELIGGHAWTLFPDAVGGPSYDAYHQARSEGRPVSVSEFYEPLGTEFEVRAFPVGDQLVVLFRDVTEERRAEARLREYAEGMAEAERIARFGIWRWEIATGAVRWSDELHHIYGVNPGDFAGTVDDFVRRVHPEDRERVWAEASEAVETLRPFIFEERILRPDGTERRVLSQGRVITGPDGKAAALVGVCHDVTERVQAERALGMSERRLRAIVDNTPSIIAVKDLEGRYLMANSEAGRVVGMNPDELIGRHGVELYPPPVAEQLRENDHVAAAEGRLVYDETMLMQDGEPRTYATVTFPLPDDEGRPVETCTIATDVTDRRERESERRERREWRNRIQAAMREDRLVVFGQPVHDLRTGGELSCELLIRMRARDDPGQLLPPATFLPMAERFELIQSIDAWVVRRALRLAPERAVEINLSAVTIADPRAREEIAALVADAPEAAPRIVFEITETAALEHIDGACSFAERIASLGCGLALDDFGTGFGSFTYLRRLPLRYLKIDRTFVSGLVRSVDDRRVVQSIISIGEQFGLRTIAEGVEDAETLELLRRMGADYVQGFYTGRPAPLQNAGMSSHRAEV